MSETLTCVLRHLHKLFDTRTSKDLTDEELLDRFLTHREETAFSSSSLRYASRPARS